jgi:hypothetical protein
MVFNLWIFILFDLFCIEPLIVHSYLNDIIILVSEKILRLCFVDDLVSSYAGQYSTVQDQTLYLYHTQAKYLKS